MVASTSSPPGAEMTTFFAPAAICAEALALLVKRPVHSSTKSTPSSPQGSLEGSRCATTRMRSPFTTIESPSTCTSPRKRPCTVSNRVKCTLVLASPKSLIATTLISFACLPSYSARRILRPIRPYPLIATLIAIFSKPPVHALRAACHALRAACHALRATVNGVEATPPEDYCKSQPLCAQSGQYFLDCFD